MFIPSSLCQYRSCSFLLSHFLSFSLSLPPVLPASFSRAKTEGCYIELPTSLLMLSNQIRWMSELTKHFLDIEGYVCPQHLRFLFLFLFGGHMSTFKLDIYLSCHQKLTCFFVTSWNVWIYMMYWHRWKYYYILLDSEFAGAFIWVLFSMHRFICNICGSELDGWAWSTCFAIYSSLHIRYVTSSV